MSLEKALQGDLRDGSGLAAHSQLQDVIDALQPALKVHKPATHERFEQRFDVVLIDREQAPGIEVWFRFGEPQVAFIEQRSPVVADLAQTLEHFGPPDAVMSDERFQPDAVVKEYVFASRGITLSIAYPIGALESRERNVIHLQLYPPTSVQNYITNIGVGQALRPYPRND